MKFIHAADLHLDAPLRGLVRYEGAPHERIRRAGRDAFERLIASCLEHEVDFLLLAGDLLDGSGRDFNTVLYLAGQLRRLQDAGIEVFAVLGNHDAGHDLLTTNPFPDNVHLFSSDKAHSHLREAKGVAIHGQSHANRAEQRNLAAGYPPAVPGLFNIGLLHTALDGRAGQITYAPCSEHDLLTPGYQYWALGHIHQRELVRPRDPMILFSGTIQGRHIRESGVKGATLVTVDGERGEVTATRHLPLDLVRWHILTLDIGPIESFESLSHHLKERLERSIEPEVLNVVRLRLTGRSPWRGQLALRGLELEQELRIHTLNTGGDSLWLERVVDETSMMEQVSREHGTGVDTDAGLDPLDLMDRVVGELLRDEVALTALFEPFRPLGGLMRTTAFHGMASLPFQDPEWMRVMVRQAQTLAAERLRHPEGG
ncbi:MAG: DNA repair exonuclease [Magnetococcales bacterium]|nr:DNA repair exonuclease [Magnetococcales bacterium]